MSRVEGQVEGYEYDLTADMLTVRVVSGQPGMRAERSAVDINITGALRGLIDASIMHVSCGLAATDDFENLGQIKQQSN